MAHSPLITSTDTAGRITFANDAFLRATGLSEHEVLGAPHSIVRHPGMPASVFENLWAGIKAGLPWTGLIRNRRRTGQDFWVKATVIPARRGDRTLGYTSVQSCPSAAEVAHAEAVYRQWCGERDGPRRHVLRHGRIVEVGWRAWLRALRHPFDLPAQRRVLGTAALQVALFGACAAAAISPAPVAYLLGAVGGWQVWALTGASIGIAAATAIALYFHWRVLAPIRDACRAAAGIAGGDLTREFGDRAATGELRDLNRALDQMVAKMAAVLLDSHGRAAETGRRVNSLADDAARLAARSVEQSNDVRDIVAQTDDIGALGVRTSQGADAAHGASGRAASDAVQACTAAATLRASMEDLSSLAARIGDISDAIDAISMQTGVLALNAAAAASRHGDTGRVFAVVAAEVRALAKRSGEAAQEIRSLSRSSGEKMTQGLKLATGMGEHLEATSEGIRAVDTRIAQIRADAREQAQGVLRINGRLAALAQSTRENATLARDSAASSARAIEEVARLKAAIAVCHLEAASEDDQVEAQHPS